MGLNGIMFVSAVLNLQTILFGQGNDLPYVLYLPTYAATAWYHKKLPAELSGNLAKTLAEAEAFAMGGYVQALPKGDWIDGHAAAGNGRQGGPLDRSVGRVRLADRPEGGERAVLQGAVPSEGRTVGRFDSRYRLGRGSAGAQTEYDPDTEGRTLRTSRRSTTISGGSWLEGRCHLRDLPPGSGPGARKATSSAI